MALRTVMIFPKFQNMEIIDAIRAEYDPLSKLVKPHITLVFPFDLKLSDEELGLFLDVNEGNNQLSRIHCKLYSDELKKLDSDLKYIPHMTIGKLKTGESLLHAYDKVKGLEATFKTVIDTISVETIGENKESTIIIQKKLE